MHFFIQLLGYFLAKRGSKNSFFSFFFSGFDNVTNVDTSISSYRLQQRFMADYSEASKFQTLNVPTRCSKTRFLSMYNSETEPI